MKLDMKFNLFCYVLLFLKYTLLRIEIINYSHSNKSGVSMFSNSLKKKQLH